MDETNIATFVKMKKINLQSSEWQLAIKKKVLFPACNMVINEVPIRSDKHTLQYFKLKLTLKIINIYV